MPVDLRPSSVCLCVEPLPEADKNDQWLGVSVSSQGTDGGRALVSTRARSQSRFGRLVWHQKSWESYVKNINCSYWSTLAHLSTMHDHLSSPEFIHWSLVLIVWRVKWRQSAQPLPNNTQPTSIAVLFWQFVYVNSLKVTRQGLTRGRTDLC